MPEKTVLITGSSKGLGRSLAELFAKNGFNIILHGRDRIGLRQTQGLVLKNQVQCDIVQGDVTSSRTIRRLYDLSVKRDLDVLINNAGVYLNQMFQLMEPEAVREIIEVNLIAPMILSRSLYPIFKKKKSGLIININSIAGKNPSEGESVYCASKHGLRGFSKSIQLEAIKDQVRVVEVYLGAMNTAMVQNRKEPEKRIQPDETAECIYNICKNYSSLRINEIDIGRRRY